jgi:hypothetical protein
LDHVNRKPETKFHIYKGNLAELEESYVITSKQFQGTVSTFLAMILKIISCEKNLLTLLCMTREWNEMAFPRDGTPTQRILADLKSLLMGEEAFKFCKEPVHTNSAKIISKFIELWGERENGLLYTAWKKTKQDKDVLQSISNFLCTHYWFLFLILLPDAERLRTPQGIRQTQITNVKLWKKNPVKRCDEMGTFAIFLQHVAWAAHYRFCYKYIHPLSKPNKTGQIEIVAASV